MTDIRIFEGMTVFWKSAHSNRPFRVEEIIRDGQNTTFRLKQDGKLFSTADAKNLIPVTKLGKLDSPATFWSGDGLSLHVPDDWVCIRGEGMATFYPPKKAE